MIRLLRLPPMALVGSLLPLELEDLQRPVEPPELVKSLVPLHSIKEGVLQ